MIFLELVPRNTDNLLSIASSALEKHSQITGINIPDIKRIDIRSYDAVEFLLQHNITALPHIRAQDMSIETHLRTIEKLINKGLKQVLIITGDPIKSQSIPAFNTTTLELVSALKKRFSSLIVYCGIDAYRQEESIELDYADKKLQAGADGFFSQPFFDIHLAESYLKRFKSCEFFVGIAPVTKQSSYDYWVSVNKVSFPSEFQLDLAYNCNLAKRLIDLANSYNQHSYLMPIKTPVASYLEGIF